MLSCRRSGRVCRYTPPRRLASFTLVEVVIAVAVTAFVVISILGLMVYASNVVQQSDKYARLASVASQVQAALDSQNYNGIRKTGLTTNLTYYFTSEALPTNSAAAFYQCDVTNSAPTSSSLNDLFGNSFIEPVQIKIRWPKPIFSNTNVIVSSIVNYD